MVEGRGYSGRRQERLRAERLRRFIEEKDRIVVIPDEGESRTVNSRKNRNKHRTKVAPKPSSEAGYRVG